MRAGWFYQGRENRPPMPPLQSDVLRASKMPELQQTHPRTPMKRTAHKTSQDDGQQLLFSDRPTIADRTATGELIDVSNNATASGFRWPLTVSAALHRDVQTIPRGSGRAEVVSLRWNTSLPSSLPPPRRSSATAWRNCR